MATSSTWYRTGTVTVANNSQAVVGVNSLWAAQVLQGDLFALADANGNISTSFYEVDSVTNDTHLTLKTPWAGASASGQKYVLIRNFTGTLPSDLAARLSDMLAGYQLHVDELEEFMTTAGPMTITGANGQPINTVGMLSLAGAGSAELSILTMAQDARDDSIAAATASQASATASAASATQAAAAVASIGTGVTNAGTSASNAAASAAAASSSAIAASGSATAAALSKNDAANFASNASSAVTNAARWAELNYGVQVTTGLYSAKHWATVASTHAASAQAVQASVESNTNAAAASATAAAASAAQAESALRQKRILKLPNAYGIITINWSLYDEVRIKMAGDVIVYFTGAGDGQGCILKITQDATGGRVLHLPLDTIAPDVISGGYSVSSTPNATDRLGFIYDADESAYALISIARNLKKGS